VAKIVLSIDLGGTKILTVLVDENGTILSRDHTPTPAARGPDAVIEAIMSSSDQVLKHVKVEMKDITAVSIAAAGPSDMQKGILFTSPNLPGWKNVHLKDILSQKTGKPTYFLNDARAAALGEFYFGSAKGSKDCIYVTISTGIGGGIIINNELYTGAAGTAGEIGHTVIDDDGPLCNCGNKGCWEMLASGTALAESAKRQIKEGTQTSITRFAGGDIEKVNAQAINEAAIDGDQLAQQLISRTAYYLGVGFANLINIFSPELIVIGGGLSNIGDRLLLPAYEEAKRRAFTQPYEVTRFVTAALGLDSGVMGAAGFAFKQIGARKTAN
jgi:glucokinase